MFFTVKYIDYLEFEALNRIQEVRGSQESFAGENKRLLVNPDCPIGIIRDYIANSLLLGDEDVATFELCTDKGTIVKTSQALPSVCGLQFLKEKETYYVLLTTNNFGSASLQTPLLNKFSKEFIDFIAQQKRNSTSGRQKSLTSNKSSSKDLISIGSTSKTGSQTTK